MLSDDDLLSYRKLPLPEHGFRPVFDFDLRIVKKRVTPLQRTLSRIKAEVAKPKRDRIWYCGLNRGTSQRKFEIYTEWLVQEADAFKQEMTKAKGVQASPFYRHFLQCLFWTLGEPDKMKERLRMIVNTPKELREQLIEVEVQNEYRNVKTTIKRYKKMQMHKLNRAEVDKWKKNKLIVEEYETLSDADEADEADEVNKAGEEDKAGESDEAGEANEAVEPVKEVEAVQLKVEPAAIEPVKEDEAVEINEEPTIRYQAMDAENKDLSVNPDDLIGTMDDWLE